MCNARFLLPFVLLFVASLSQAGTTPALGHIVVVALENHSYSQVVGDSSMPYLNGLINQYGLATNFYANTHGSLPNYLDLTTGELVTLDDGFAAPVSIDNIERELLRAGKTWKAYAQSIPSVGYTGGDRYPYVKHHNPFAYFSDNLNGSSQAQNIVDLGQFSTDVGASTLPNFSFVIPDNEHNAHDCVDGSNNCTDAQKLATADQFLATYIAPLFRSPQFQADGLLVIWWDEGDLSDGTYGGGHVAIVLAGPGIKTGYRSTTFYRHEHLLRTFAEGLGLATFPGSSIYVPSMAEFFGAASGGSGTGTLSGTVTNISNGAGISGATVTYSGGSTTTGSGGTYSFSNVAPGAYTVSAVASGYFKETNSGTVTSGTTTTVNIALPTGGKVQGTVNYSNGTAISGASVSVTCASGTCLSYFVSTSTNSSGYYNSNWVPVGTYSVSVTLPGTTQKQSKTVSVSTGSTSTLNFTF